MLRTPIVALLALAACADVNSVTGDIIPFGQVYDCDLTIDIGAPTNQTIDYPSHPCLADEDAEGAYEQAWVDTVCFPYLETGPGKGLPGHHGCYGDCHLKDYGFDICTP